MRVKTRDIIKKQCIFAAVVWAGLVISAVAHAQAIDIQSRPVLPPAYADGQLGILNLSTTATAEVSSDLASMQWFIEISDTDASSASLKVSKALNDALSRIRQDPAVLQKRTQISSSPTYNKEEKIIGWTARAELLIEGSDFIGLAKAGQHLGNGFAIGQVSYRLSGQVSALEEQRLTVVAIRDFSQKAQQSAQHLGYKNYRIKEININSSAALVQPYRKIMRMAVSDAASAPLEGGQTSVTVTVTGSVFLID